MVQDKHAALELIRKNQASINKFGITRVGLFGSFSTNSQTQDSDIDLLVEFDPAKKTYKNFIGFTQFAEQIFGRNVDVLTPESLSPYIGPRIKQQAEYVQTA